MKRKKYIKRILSFILATVLLLSSIPVSLAVQDLFDEETTSKIVREVTELREESVKHFLCEDGSYIAATYSAPVHYKENGEWKEIDNSLSLDRTTLSESGKPTYTTKAGGLSVSVPQSFSDGQKITAKNKGYEIRFGVNSNQPDVSLKTPASVVKIETLSSNLEVVDASAVKSTKAFSTISTSDIKDIEAYNSKLMTVDNQSSAVTYKEIMPDTDFEYIVTSNSNLYNSGEAYVIPGNYIFGANEITNNNPESNYSVCSRAICIISGTDGSYCFCPPGCARGYYYNNLLNDDVKQI